MFAPAKVLQSTSGMNTSAPASPSWRVISISLPAVKRMGQPQWPQAVSIVTVSRSRRSRPCTKGVAIASSAQAPKSRSPVWKARRCGVGSTVTG